MIGLIEDGKFNDKFSSFDTVHDCGRQTNTDR